MRYVGVTTLTQRWLGERSRLLPPAFKTGRESCPLIRLLNAIAPGMRTSIPQRTVPCCLLVVAMTMEHLPVHDGILAADTQRHDVVHFQHVSISKVQSAPHTSSLLPPEQ